MTSGHPMLPGTRGDDDLDLYAHLSPDRLGEVADRLDPLCAGAGVIKLHDVGWIAESLFAEQESAV